MNKGGKWKKILKAEGRRLMQYQKVDCRSKGEGRGTKRKSIRSESEGRRSQKVNGEDRNERKKIAK